MAKIGRDSFGSRQRNTEEFTFGHTLTRGLTVRAIFSKTSQLAGRFSCLRSQSGRQSASFRFLSPDSRHSFRIPGPIHGPIQSSAKDMTDERFTFGPQRHTLQRHILRARDVPVQPSTSHLFFSVLSIPRVPVPLLWERYLPEIKNLNETDVTKKCFPLSMSTNRQLRVCAPQRPQLWASFPGSYTLQCCRSPST